MRKYLSLFIIAMLALAACGSDPDATDVATDDTIVDTSDTSVTTDPDTTSGTDSNTSSSNTCRLDKVGTWSEGNNPHRIEVGGHGGQHLDYYPTTGVKSVSYIVGPIPNPEGVPNILFGFGSIWEGNGPECDDFDWEADATAYATARLDSGHSGLVVQDGNIVANVGTMSEEEAQEFIENFFVTKSNGSTQMSANCENAAREDHEPTEGTTWMPSGDGWRAVNFWTNEQGHDQAERKLLLAPGENPNLRGGGASYSWPASCEQAARDGFAQNTLIEVTLDQLKTEGLAS